MANKPVPLDASWTDVPTPDTEGWADITAPLVQEDRFQPVQTAGQPTQEATFEGVNAQNKASQKTQSQNIRDTDKGILETGAMLATGFFAAPAAAIGGAIAAGAAYMDGSSDTDPSDAFTSVFNETMDKATYHPESDSGKEIAEVIGIPFEYMAEKGQGAGQWVMETTGSPTAAAAVHTMVEGSIYIAGYLGPKAMQKEKVKKEVKAKAIMAQGVTSNIDQAPLTPAEFKAALKEDKPYLQDTALDGALSDYQAGIIRSKARANPSIIEEFPVVAEFAPTTLTFEQFRNSPFNMNETGIIQLTPKESIAKYNDYVTKKANENNLDLNAVGKGTKDSAMQELAFGIREGEVVKQQVLRDNGEAQAKGIWSQGAAISDVVTDALAPVEFIIAGKVKARKPGEGLVLLEELEAPKVSSALPGTETTTLAKGVTPDNTHNYMHKTMEVLGLSKSVGELFKKSEASPALKEVVSYIERPEMHRTVSRQVIGADISEGYHLTAGKWIGKFEEAMNPIKSRTSSILGAVVDRRPLTPAMNKDLYNKLTDTTVVKEGIKDDSPLGKAAGQVRQILDEAFQHAKDVGVPVAGYVKGHLPRVFNNEVMSTSKARDGLFQVLTKHGVDTLTAEKYIARIIEGEGILQPEMAVGKWRNATGEKGPKKHTSMEMERTLRNIPASELLPYLETDVSALVTKYLHDSANRIEYTKRFGAGEEKLTALLNTAQAELANKGLALNSMDLNKIKNLLDIQMKQYIQITNPVARKGFQASSTLANVMLLPLTMLNSVGELTMPMRRSTMPAFLKAIPQTARDMSKSTARRVFKDLGKSQAEYMAAEILKVTDQSMAERMAALAGGKAHAVDNTFFRTTLQHSLYKASSLLAVNTFNNMSMAFLENMASGKKPKLPWAKAEEGRMLDLMAYHGIDVNAGVAWVKRGAPRKNDKFYDEQFKLGVYRFANNSALAPRAAILPLWASNPYLQPINKLNNYMFMLGNSVGKEALFDITHQLKKGNVYTAAGNASRTVAQGVGMYGMLYLASDLLEQIKFGDNPPKVSDEDKMYKLLEKMGVYGQISKYKTALFSHEFGGQPVETLAGPIPGKIIKGTGILTEALATGNNRELARFAARSTPIINQNKQVRDDFTEQLERLLDDLDGRPEKKKAKNAKKDRYGGYR